MTEYKIIRLGHQGDGIAEGPLFAAQTLPGEVVTGTSEGQTLRDIRIVTPSDQRVSAPCRHFKSCGGCQLQHASDGFVADWKQDIVRSALKSHGLVADLRPILTSPARARRRATFTARRTKKGAMAGFNSRGSDVVVEVPDCQLLSPDVLSALPIAQRLAVAGASRKAAISVAVTQSDQGLDVVVTGGKPLDGPLQQELAQICEATGLARLSWDEDVITMRAPPGQQFGSARVVPPPGAFLQATVQAEQALLSAVQETVAGAGHVIDLFAGCGTFSLPLAAQASVHAVEGDAAMLCALDQGWRKAEGLKPVTTETRDLFRRPLLPDELSTAEAIVLDPPRAGAEAQVRELVPARIPTVAYVSCNPISFARDAAALVQGGYRLDWIQVVDQFRWSSHVELAASFMHCTG